MKLFTIGPVQMYSHTLSIKSKIVPYFRTPEFSEIMFNTDSMLKKIAGTSQSSKSVYLTASGTAAMEAAVINCFSSKDKLLVINGGSFGMRFSKICDVHCIPHEDIILSFGKTLGLEHMERFENKGFTGLLVNHNESSTGQLYDIKLIRDFCLKNNMCLIVDAISTFMCDPFNMDDFGIDVAIFSSQKGLCLSPGISIILVNEKTATARVEINKPRTLYFDFKDYFINIARGQTPFTPAVGILLELNDMLGRMLKTGVDKHLHAIAAKAVYFRSRIREIGARLPNYPLSNAITPIIFDKPLALGIFNFLKDNFDIFVNPCSGEMENYMLRISHIGNLTFDDYDMLINCIKEYYETVEVN